MFVRKLKHSNGKIYIQVVHKDKSKYKVLKSFGTSSSIDGLELLETLAHDWITNKKGIIELDFDNEIKVYEAILNQITSHKLVGIDLVLGKIFNEIGFNQIRDELFKDLVLYRLVYPKSKLKTTEYLYRFSQKNYSEDDIYRYMDKLHSKQKELCHRSTFE